MYIVERKSPEDFAVVAVELLRALRGRRTQTGLSRRIGYRSNIVHRWETQQCWPTAARFLSLCGTLGKDLDACHACLFRRRPTWLGALPADSPEAVAALLSDLRGKTPVVELARRTTVNRHTVARWLKGTAQPNLPQWLCMIHATSGRLHEFVNSLVDPSSLPSLEDEWRQLQLSRRVALDEPWSHAVLRALQLDTCPRNRSPVRFIAGRLALPEREVRRLLAVLVEAGQVRARRGRYVAESVARVDTGGDSAASLELKSTWAQVSAQRMRQGAPGSFGYSLFEVSRGDLQKLRDLHLEYVRAMLSVIAASQGTECVGLYVAHLLDMADHEDNALAPAPAPAKPRA